MSGLIPWRQKKMQPAGNGGTLAPLRDFPTIMRRMQSEFDELFDRFAQQWPMSLGEFGRGSHWYLEVNDEVDNFTVRAEAPGFEADDFDIRVSGDRLMLRATKKTEKKEKGSEFREQCACYESMTLPPGIDKDKIEARYHNGVLTVTIPKTKEGRGKKIAVKEA